MVPVLKKICVQFTFEDILKDIISKKSGDCFVSDRAEYWLNKLKKDVISEKAE